MSLVELHHLVGDERQRILYGEVARLKPMHLGFRKILQVGLTAFTREEAVVLASEDKRFWLAIA